MKAGDIVEILGEHLKITFFCDDGMVELIDQNGKRREIGKNELLDLEMLKKHRNTHTETDMEKYIGAELDAGTIWTNRGKYFVVTGTQRADWRGENIDVYAHISTWYETREATAEEISLYDNAANSWESMNAVYKTVGAARSWGLNGNLLSPPAEATRMLDSYDDRYSGPKPVTLTDDQVAAIQTYQNAAAACKNLPVS